MGSPLPAAKNSPRKYQKIQTSLPGMETHFQVLRKPKSRKICHPGKLEGEQLPKTVSNTDVSKSSIVHPETQEEELPESAAHAVRTLVTPCSDGHQHFFFLLERHISVQSSMTPFSYFSNQMCLRKWNVVGERLVTDPLLPLLLTMPQVSRG